MGCANPRIQLGAPVASEHDDPPCPLSSSRRAFFCVRIARRAFLTRRRTWRRAARRSDGNRRLDCGMAPVVGYLDIVEPVVEQRIGPGLKHETR